MTDLSSPSPAGFVILLEVLSGREDSEGSVDGAVETRLTELVERFDSDALALRCFQEVRISPATRRIR